MTPSAAITKALAALKATPSDLARAVHTTPQRIHELVHGLRPVTPRWSLLLAPALRLPPDYLAALQLSLDIAKAQTTYKQLITKVKPL